MLIWVNSVTEKTGNGQLQWSTNNIHKAKGESKPGNHNKHQKIESQCVNTEKHGKVCTS